MGETYESLGLQVIMVTEASATGAMQFANEQKLPFPVFADALETRKAFGIEMIWGSPVFLLDASGQVVAEELDEVEEFLAEHAIE